MAAGAVKGDIAAGRAGTGFVDVEAEETVHGDAGQIGADQAAVTKRVEQHFARKVGAGIAAAHHCAGGGFSFRQYADGGWILIVQG